MTLEILTMLLVLVCAVVLFSGEWLRIDVVVLLILSALTISGILTPEETFSGFSSELIIVLASIFVISGALARSGLMQTLGQLIHTMSKDRKGFLAPLLALMGVSAAVSAVISNTSATAILMPVAKDVAKRREISVSRFLMPLAFASILGGTCTLVGTSTNLAGGSLVVSLGLEPLAFFEFAKAGLILALLGMLYLAIIGPYLVPVRCSAKLTKEYGIQAYLSELSIPTGSSVVGKQICEVNQLGQDVRALVIVRKGVRIFVTPHQKIQANDTIIVKAPREALLGLFEDRKDFLLEAERTLDENELVPSDAVLAESVLMPHSKILGKTLKQLFFFQRFGVAVLAISRRGQVHPVRIDRMKLQAGDVLLLQGPESNMDELRRNPDLWGLSNLESALSKRRGFLVLGGLILAVIFGVSGIVPLSVSFLLAGLSMVLTKSITMEEAYGLIDWRLLVLIGGMTSVGLAMQKTGTAEYLAELLIDVTTPYGVYATMAVLALITIGLTQPMSNAAAAMVVIPIAVSAAGALGVDPRSLAILVILSASLSFITPFEPASLLVYGAGHYRFVDFVRVGLPMTIMLVFVLVVIVPLIWPLR
ncbi:MAG: SLC13 family permease [Akkermansiaceae bacterium]